MVRYLGKESQAMKLIVGLGNPGKEYANTRHNMGFMVIDALAKKWNLSQFKTDFQGEYIQDKTHAAILLKPTTFMNLSGQSVQALVQFYKISSQEIVVVYDDLALEPGKIRLRMTGSSGSHNGMQSVIESLSTQEIKRIRIGIGAVPMEQKGKDYVLGIPSKDDQTKINQSVQDAVSAIELYLKSNFSQAMNQFNRGGND